MIESSAARSGHPFHDDPPFLPRVARLCWILLIAGALATVAVAYLVAIEYLYLGNGRAGWVYRYNQEHDFELESLVIAALASVATLALLAVTTNARRDWLVIGSWLLVGLALQGMLRSLTPVSFEDMFVSDNSNGFYSVTKRLFASNVLANFETVRLGFPPHAEANMPGKLILVYALKYFSRSTDVLPWLVVIVSNLGGLFCYLFVWELLRDRRVALYSLVLYLLTPGKLFFFPLLNTPTPTFVMLCAYLLMRTLRTGRLIYPLLMGAAVYAMAFYEPLPLVMGIVFAALGVAAIRQGDITFTKSLWQFGLVVLGFAVTYGAVRADAGFDLFDAFRRVWIDEATFNRVTERPYWFWVRQNIADFSFGVGACQVAAVCAVVWIGLVRPDSSGRRFVRPITVLTLSLLAAVITNDLLGVHRGEVIREWIFFACFFQIPVAYICARLNHRAAIALVVTTTLLLDALGTSMIAFVDPS